MQIVIFGKLDVIRTSLISGEGGGPDISAPEGGLIPEGGGGPNIPIGGF